MTIEVAIGDSTVMVADELPAAGIVSPLTLGGTYGTLVIAGMRIINRPRRTL